MKPVNGMLISPAERPPVSNLGVNSSLCERLGADVLWEGARGLAGVQRKELSDLIASVRPAPGQEPRLGKEIAQMTSSLAYAFLVVEGIPQWDRDGNLMSQFQSWTMKNHNGVLLSVQSAGVMVLTSRNALETCAVIEYLADWTMKTDHVSSLLARPKPPTNGWGRADDRSTMIHVWSGLPGVGPERAARIYDAGIKLIKCGTSVEELTTVPGIGKKTAEGILKVLGG